MSTFGNVSPETVNVAADAKPPFFSDIRPGWFTAEPNAKRSREIARFWRTYWQYQATEALLSASEGLRQDFSRLINNVQSVDLNRKISPRLIARLVQLLESMGRQDYYAVMDCIQKWCADPLALWSSDSMVTESIAVEAWEDAILREIRATKISDHIQLECFPLFDRDIQPFHTIAEYARDLIRQVDRDMSAEIDSHITHIKLFDGSGIEGLSSPKTFGVIWLKVPTERTALDWFLEHIVHECSHLHLNVLMAMDPLLINPNEFHRAPIRPDPRPLFQVLHGTFVLARNCRVHSRLVAKFPELNLGAKLDKFRDQLKNGLEVIQGVMKPTKHGQRVISSLIRMAETSQ